ncbi:MAG: amino acid adenylation domain-containing protein, partial [Chlorobiaceae bacterium]|nr:amino acid adenylation domain-containing protein [Chlorobiaceae bacterium]
KLSDFARKIGSETPVSSRKSIEMHESWASEGEKEFWIAETAGLDTRSFTIPMYYRVIGPLPFDRLQHAWSTLVERHDALKTFFRQDLTGKLARHVDNSGKSSIEYAEMPDRETAVAHIRVRQADSLSMTVAPLWRAGLVSAVDSGEQYFWMAIHHSIADGESLGALLNELASLLAGSDLPDLQKGCGYFAAREHAYLDSDDATSDAGFWQGLLKDLPATAFEELPLDSPRSPATPTGNHRLSILIDRQTAEGVRTIARRHESSLHSLMIALLAMEVNRRTGRSRVLVGTPASLRESATDSRTVAYGINMLPLPVTVGRNMPFGEILRATQSLMAEALQHARYPFNLICRNFWKARPELRDPQRFPMFDLAVTENPFCSGNGEQQKFIRDVVPDTASWYEFTEAMPGQDVVLIHEEQDGNGMFLQLQFNAAVFSKATAGNWAEAVAAWLNWLGEEPAHADEPLPRLLPHEVELLKRLETARKVDRPRFRFHELFETVVDRPGQDIRPAISASGISMNYRELEADSNGISWLLQQHGARRGSVVAVLTGCSPRLPSVVLAIWKAGATYLPLDAALPETRRLFMMKDAGCSLLVSIDAETSIETPGSKVPTLVLPKIDGITSCAQVRPAVAGSPDDIAYIIYTSGSTGAPKGVLVSHANYINLVLGSSEILGIRPDDRYLMSASPSFDVSLSDIGVPLSSGAAVCPVTEEVIQSRALFLEFLHNEAITVVDTTPAYLALFHDTGLPPTVRLLITGGEAPLPADIKKHAGTIPYFNAYGPTENTITSTIGKLSDREPELMTAGRPLPNTFVLIRDGAGIPVVPGSAGEILLGGTGVASGYLDRPDLTREKFVESPEGRIYRSGDLGRWLPDGSLQVIGRIDGQLKFNGIRIEPGEIEYTLSEHPAVSQAVVLSHCEKNGIKSLWAFVLLSPGRKADGPPDWNRYLAEHLPSRILPSGVFVVEKMPVTLTGKIDRTLLLNIIEEKRENGSGLTVPADELERMIGEVWSSVFRQRAIHREDNFFALGGHSLLAISVAHKLETLLGRPVPARHLFAEPTLAGFSGKLRENITGEQIALKATDSATVGQQEFWVAERAGFSTGGFNMTLILSVRQEKVTIERWREIWNLIALRHEALRTSFFEEPSGKLQRLVAGKSEVALDIFDAASETGALAMIRNLLAEPFSMTSPQLWRAGLARVADGDDLIWLAMHHSISDGLSLAILVDELAALVKNEILEPAAPAFSTIAAAEERYLEGEASATDASYWKTAFDSLIERDPGAFDEWHLDKPRPTRREASSKLGRYCFHRHIDTLTAERLRSTASRNGSSMHALMLALTGHEVRRRTGRTGFVIGTTASIRQSEAEARTVGYCINMLPLTMPPPGDGTIDASIRSMQQSLAEAFQHARYPFARICSDFRQQHPQMKMHPSRYPLFDIAVTENPSPGSASPSALVPVKAAGTNEGEDGRLQENAPLQDLVLVHEEQSDGSIRLAWYADAAIYSRDVAKTWIDSIAGWMRFIAGCRSEKSIRLPKLLPHEQKLIDTWQYGARLPFPAPSLPALFDKFAKDAPDSPAIVTDRGVRRYRDVSISSRTLSEALVRTGLKRGEAVAVYTSRSASLPETVMGIWKSGGCYVPMSNELPEERLAFMMSDCSARILLVLDGLTLPTALETSADLVLRPEELDLSTQSGENGLPYPGPEERGCIIYTSGTTGKPKGVVLHHGGMLNLGLAGAEKLGIRTDDRMMIMAAPSFDLWLSDISVSWSSGAAIVPVTRSDIEDLHEMRSLMARLKVSVATMSPSYLRQFERSAFPGLRILMTVGEPPIPADARHYAESLEYFNGYGPTENSAASTIGRIDGEAELIDVGKPLSNTAVQVLDNEGDPVPPGVYGEIWLSGKGLAEGYLGLPELTASAFVETDTGRRYRSGDLGRWLPSGTLQILGRSDSQVKLRGQRIELGEIENCLESIPEIRHAVALIQKQDEYSWVLKAAVSLVPGSVPASPAQWTAFLSGRLPSWMIPSAISIVRTIPLNASGKTDMHALTAEMASHPDDTNTLDVPSAKPPLTTAEQRIAEVWTEQLGLSAIGPYDNFFELGGDSLKAIGSVNRLRHEFRCSVNDLYEHPVLSEFALVCHPQPDHVRSIIEKARNIWLETSSSLPEMERSRNRALENLRREYKQRNREYALRDMEFRQPYQHILLTGATGYLGSYLLRELLKNPAMQVTLIVRDAGSSARERLDESLVHYFGPEWLETTGRSSRLTVLSGDLRHDRFSLSSREYGLIAESVDAIIHCAANVSHIGHYSDFHADNVETTSHLLNLAARNRPSPIDFHYLSTLSVAGKGKPGEPTLFTEYDPAPEEPDTNYYVRTKQEAEALVRASRGKLENACIHRIGNIGFSTDSAVLQKNITENAFFRQLVALIRFGAIPEDLGVAISHVDTVARAVIQLACTPSLANETHHIETPRRIRLIDLIKSSPATRQERIESCGIDEFLERLKTAVDDPLLDDVVNQIVETFGLGEGLTPQSRMMRAEIECGRTVSLLEKLGVTWPEMPITGRDALLEKAFLNSCEESVGK